VRLPPKVRPREDPIRSVHRSRKIDGSMNCASVAAKREVMWHKRTKTARIAWAIMAKGEVYRAPTATLETVVAVAA